MLRILKQIPLGSTMTFKQPLKMSAHIRSLATVEANAPLQMPVKRTRAKPTSHDRATFTIRVCVHLV